MWNDRDRTPEQGHVRARSARRWLAACVIGGALLPALGTAQTLTVPTGPLVTVLESGLQSVFERRSLLLTVTESGSSASASEVTIEFRDAADQRRGFASGTLLRANPIWLRLPIRAGAGLDRLRAIVTITPLTNVEGSAPIVGLEDIDADAFQVVPRIVCAGAGPSVGGGAEADCGGWHRSQLTLEQAHSPR